MLKYYREFYDKFNYIYSLDMVRYNFSIFSQNMNDFYRLIEKFPYQANCDCKYFNNKKSIGYTDLWNFTTGLAGQGSCSWVVGRQLNHLQENKNSGFIEFNPNKCMEYSYFSSFFQNLIELCSNITLVRYDVAIDLPLPKEKVKMIRTGRSNYEYLIESSKVDKAGTILNASATEYQGRRNKNKFTKLYDKTKESHLDYDLTRIEFTFERNEIKFENLAKFFVLDNKLIKIMDFGKLSQNDIVFVDLLRNCDDLSRNLYLRNLSYRFRKKIEPFLNDATFDPDISTIKSVRDLALYFET